MRVNDDFQRLIMNMRFNKNGVSDLMTDMNLNNITNNQQRRQVILLYTRIFP